MGATTEEIFHGDKIGKNWNNRDIARFHPTIRMDLLKENMNSTVGSVNLLNGV